MLSKARKKELTGELTEQFKKSKITFFSDFHGISVSKLQALRRLLKKNNAEYKVAKKTLLDRAISEAGINASAKELKGELGVTFSYGEETDPAKTLIKFTKSNETFKVLGAILGGRMLNAKEVVTLSKLPSREVLLGNVAGAFASPIRGLAVALQGNIRGLVVVLQKIKEQK